VPVTAIAWDILMEAKEAARTLDNDAADPSPYVFTTTGDRPISGFGKAKARVDRAASKTRDESGPVAPWTVHDLRRTVATGLGKLGASRFIIGRVLNHADATVTGIYDRHAYLNEKRHALESWGTYLGNLIRPVGANVVDLRTGA